METKLNEVYKSVIEAPIPVHTDRSHGIVDYTLVRYGLIPSFYGPFGKWRDLATALQDLIQGNSTTTYKFVEADIPIFKCDCDLDKYEFGKVPDPLMAYVFNDGDPVPPDLESAQAHYRTSTEWLVLGSFGHLSRLRASK